MRLLIINLLAAALVCLGAISASAYEITLSSDYDGHPVAQSESVTVDVSLTINPGEAGVSLVSVAVLFDDTSLSYNIGASSSPTYAFYSPAAGKSQPAAYLIPAFPQPQIRVGTTNQVNVDWYEHILGNHTFATGTASLATLVFHVDNVKTSDLVLSMTSPGNTFTVDDGAGSVVDVKGTVALLGSPVTVVPEPTTAALIGLGLVGLGVAGRRRE